MKKITLLRIMVIGLVVIAGTHLAVATNYAVLIEGDSPIDYDEFWNDTFLMYEILIDNGFDPDNIFVLYYNGTDHASANPRYQPGSPENSHIVGPITDYAATIANVTLVFNGLANGDALNGIPQMTGNDFLFVWTFDHGSFDDTNTNWEQEDDEPSILCLMGSYIDSTTFASLVNSISYSRRVFVMQQCYSGGFIPNLSNNNTVIFTACDINENSKRADDIPATENEVVDDVTYHHGEFNYHMMNALHWLTPTRDAIIAQDTNGNRSPSMLEVFNWVQTHESVPETPQYNDPGGIGDFVHTACLEPGEEVDIFIRDHHYWIDPELLLRRPPDDGSVPSNLHGEPMSISPYILVDSNLDGIPDANPEFGQENYIYANVCNINAPTAGPIDAAFYWADPTVGLSWPDDWNLIGTGTISSLLPGNCTTTPHYASDHVSWWPPDPTVNSHYCLLAILSAPGDPAIPISGSIVNEVANDNNIAWRNVTVLNAYAGFAYNFEVYVANPFEIPRELEFGIAGVPKYWRVKARVEGVKTPIIIGKGERQRRSIPIFLKARERKKATINIIIPDNAKPGTHAFITAVSKLEGKVIGEYTYEVRIGEKEKVRGLRLSFHLGATYPLGLGSNPHQDEYPHFTNLDEIADSNVHFRFNLDYALSKRFNLMAFLGFNQFTDDYKALVHYYWFNVSANLKMFISSPSSTGLKWYWQLGPGIYIPKKNLLPPNPTATTYGGNIGLGAQIPISGPFDLEWGIDLNCTNFYSSSEPKYWFLTLQLGILFR